MARFRSNKEWNIPNYSEATTPILSKDILGIEISPDSFKPNNAEQTKCFKELEEAIRYTQQFKDISDFLHAKLNYIKLQLAKRVQ